MSIFEIPVPVDRDSPLWQRLRSASQHGASYINLDDHCDRVYRTLCERTGRYPRNTTAATAETLSEDRAVAAARRA